MDGLVEEVFVEVVEDVLVAEAAGCVSLLGCVVGGEIIRAYLVHGSPRVPNGCGGR